MQRKSLGLCPFLWDPRLPLVEQWVSHPRATELVFPPFFPGHFLDPEEDADLNQAAGMGISAPFILDSAALYASVFSSVKWGSRGRLLNKCLLQ